MAILNGIYFRTPGLSLDEATSVLGRNWGWMFAAGVAYICLGVFALLVPTASTIGLTFALACLFIATGIIQFVHAVKLRHEQGGVMRFLQSLLAIVAGVLIFLYPGIGMYGISLTLSFYFFIGAAMHWILAQAIAPGRARMWVYLSAIASFALGFYIVFTFPISALWVPGTLLGIEFLFSGTGLVGLAWAIRKLYRESKGLNEPQKSSTFWRPTSPST
ncbi:MAG: HdeD family acid-resistance protein [Pseudobdellovibrionaceae bacterium]